MACNCKKKKANVNTTNNIPQTHTTEINNDVKEVNIKNEIKDK